MSLFPKKLSNPLRANSYSVISDVAKELLVSLLVRCNIPLLRSCDQCALIGTVSQRDILRHLCTVL